MTDQCIFLGSISTISLSKNITSPCIFIFAFVNPHITVSEVEYICDIHLFYRNGNIITTRCHHSNHPKEEDENKIDVLIVSKHVPPSSCIVEYVCVYSNHQLSVAPLSPPDSHSFLCVIAKKGVSCSANLVLRKYHFIAEYTSSNKPVNNWGESVLSAVPKVPFNSTRESGTDFPTASQANTGGLFGLGWLAGRSGREVDTPNNSCVIKIAVSPNKR